MRRTYSGALACLVLVPLFAAAPLWEVQHSTSLTSINSGDFWWHLRTGLTILERHGLPHDGWFSQSAAMPWMASSWLYDEMVALGYRTFDLRVVPLLALTFKLALGIVVFVLAGGLRGRFWTGVSLSAIGQLLLFKLQPIPVYCSVLAFALELILLMEFRSTGSERILYFIPLLFLFWANLDPYFVYGIIALLLFAITCAIEQWARREAIAWLPTQGPPSRLTLVGGATGASVLATFLTPYGWGGYASFWTYVAGTANQRLLDFQSLRFRSPQDYLLLLLAMSAFLALGLRRSRDPFQIGLLALATVTAFHAQRDVWVVAIASVAVIANAVSAEEEPDEQERTTLRYVHLLAPAGVSLVLLLALFAVRVPHSREAMLATIGEAYPVGAAEYIRQQQLPAPLFNTFPWGGFLIWYLPEYPVAIDSRIDLYGPEMNAQYAKVMNFEAHYSTFAPLNQAGTILLEKNSPMAQALATVPVFKTVYSDNVAVVLVREQVGP